MALPLGSLGGNLFDLHLGIDEKIFRSLLVFIFLAVALRLGGKRELAQIKLPSGGTTSRTLLDEVDVISSVSGGTFARAYFATNGWQAMPRFEKEFLK